MMASFAAPHACGIVLAAGAGTRFGGPKALACDEHGVPWLHRVVAALTSGGCGEVLVVLGAEANRAVSLVPEGSRAVTAEAWATGLSASLAAGLAAAERTAAAVAVVTTVDVPAMPAAAVARVLSASGGSSSALVRATYAGAPGHPAVLGRDHWHAIAETAAGDQGAGPYLRARHALVVPCEDIWDGADIDRR